MRYDSYENPVAVGVLPSGGTVDVTIVLLDSATQLTTSTSSAVELTSAPGYWTFPLSNISTPITGFAQLLVIFRHSGGQEDASKIVVRGYVDEVRRIRKLVGALL